MFLASMFARSQVYSTRLKAEQALVVFVRQRDGMMHQYGRTYVDQFNACLGKEDFKGALEVWNRCIQNHWCNNSLYLAGVEETGLDKPFT